MALSLKDRRVRFGIIGGVVALALIGALLVMRGGGGGGSGSSSAVGATTPTVNPAPAPTPTTKKTPTTTVVVFSGRDPFQDLFGASPGSGSSTPTSSPTPSGSTKPPSGGQTPPPSTGGGGGSAGATTIAGHSVLLDDIFTAKGGVRKAQVEVDGTVYTVAAGESFAGHFKLVSFPSESCAHFVYGDESFTLCESGGK